MDVKIIGSKNLQELMGGIICDNADEFTRINGGGGDNL